MTTELALTVNSTEIRQFDGLYSLNDLHKAAGNEKKYQPALFMRLDQTKDLIAEIERSTDMYIAIKTKCGGKNQGTFVCKELVYAYAMWISAKFSLQVIRTFDSLQGQKADKMSAHDQSAITHDPYLTPEQKRHIQEQVAKLVKNQVGTTYAGLYGQIKTKFRVSTYKEIKKEDYPALCEFLGCKPIDAHTTNSITLKQLPKSDHIEIRLKDGKVTYIRDLCGKKIIDANHLDTLRANMNLLNTQLRQLCGDIEPDKIQPQHNTAYWQNEAHNLIQYFFENIIIDAGKTEQQIQAQYQKFKDQVCDYLFKEEQYQLYGG